MSAFTSSAGAVQTQSRGRLQRLLVWSENAFWIYFLLAAFGALSATPLGFTVLPAWLAADAFATICLLSRLGLYGGYVARCWLIFTWPLMAVISAIWSLTPDLSMYHGVQLALTMLVGIVLGVRYRLSGLVPLVFWALAPAMVVAIVYSLFLGAVDPFGSWKGGFPHKNNLGAAMVILFYTCLILFSSGWRRWLSGPTMIAALGLVVLSRSGTSVVLLVAALAILVLQRSKALPRLIRFGLGFVCFAGLCLFLLSAPADPEAIFNAGLEALGKDSSLTGRTVLWDYGWRAFMENPWLGLGFKAYFGSSETSATLVQDIVEQDLPYLHNNFLEVAVGLGIVGEILFIAGLVFAGWRLATRSFTSDEPFSAWPLVFFGTTLLTCITENPLFYNHSLVQLLMMSALVFTYRSYRR
jgi:exopolysaccharide production protein ExoQ